MNVRESVAFASQRPHSMHANWSPRANTAAPVFPALPEPAIAGPSIGELAAFLHASQFQWTPEMHTGGPDFAHFQPYLPHLNQYKPAMNHMWPMTQPPPLPSPQAASLSNVSPLMHPMPSEPLPQEYVQSSSRGKGSPQASKKRRRRSEGEGFRPYTAPKHVPTASDPILDSSLQMLHEAQKLTAYACSSLQQLVPLSPDGPGRQVRRRIGQMGAALGRQFDLMLAEGVHITSSFKPQSCGVCGTTSTPLWRRLGSKLVCNACGLRKRRAFPSSPDGGQQASKGASPDPGPRSEDDGTESSEPVEAQLPAEESAEERSNSASQLKD